MKKVELHCKTKYSSDFDSTIDLETIIWKAKEQGEKGIVFVDKDSIIAFPKIEQIYKKLCRKDKSFQKFKIGYGVQLKAVIEQKECEVIVLLKNNQALSEMYKIMSWYLNDYNKKIPLDKLINRNLFLLGLMIDVNSIKLDLSMFDYLEINRYFDISSIKEKHKIVYSNIPNALCRGELKAKEILFHYLNINQEVECRLFQDTEDTLKECNNEEIVITNTNLIFDNLENITINDEEFYLSKLNNFCEFELKVRKAFQKVFKNPSSTIKDRLEEELRMINEYNYSYLYELLYEMTNLCKKNNNYYQLDGYLNNSLVFFVLGITEIEPFDLPFELFCSEIPKVYFRVSPRFYHQKIFPYIMNKSQDKFIGCKQMFKLTKNNLPRIIKHYEIKIKKKLTSREKDYIIDILSDIPIFKKDYLNHSFYVIPNNKDVFNFTAYELKEMVNQEKTINIKSTHYDYQDLSDNLFRITFVLNDDLEFISHLREKTKKKISLCNDQKVYNLFRNTEELKIKFHILDMETGLLNIRFFDNKEMERKLINTSHLWLDNLVNLLIDNSEILSDNLYNELTKRGLALKDVFTVINYFKEIKQVLPKSLILNKVRIAYMQMYYKLYYPMKYYQEMLSNIMYEYLDDEFYQYTIDDMIKRYYELNEQSNLALGENQELKLLQLLIEMYERKINFKIQKKKIEIGE